MAASRRDFIKKVGLTGLVGLNLKEAFPFPDSFDSETSEDDPNRFTILFQGDSITDGNRTRNTDWNHIMGHGYAYLIASRLWYEYPEENLMFVNRGISGNRVKDLDTRWQQDTLNLKPDVLSILVGVNDIIAQVGNPDSKSIILFEENFKRILDRTKKVLPDTQIILCEPFILPLGWVDKNPDFWQSEISKQQMLIRKLAEIYNAVFVELQKPFTDACDRAPANYWIWDGVHPMPAGHELIARQWINGVKKKLDFIKGNKSEF